MPGYPDDTSPYAAQAHVRTASAGDPVIAWDGHGRVFMGSESSDDPAGTKKTFGDVFVAVYDNPGGPGGATINDGKRFVRSEIVNRGSSAPNLLGVFNDKTAIEADRTGGSCDGTVYFAWSRFTGNGTNNIYIARSTDHGATWSNPKSLSQVAQDVQFPDISVTANGHVYVTFRQSERKNGQTDAVDIVKSTDCGATFGAAKVLQPFLRYDATDVSDPEATPAGNPADAPFDEEGIEGGDARDCGDFDAHCESGYTFFRRDTQVRSTADQADAAHEWVYIVYDPSKPGSQVPTGTTYGSIDTGIGSQSATYFLRYDGATGTKTTPILIDDQPTGHQLFPDIAVSNGTLHAIWWDSRNDPSYSRTRPVGNDAAGHTVASLDVYGATSTTSGASWTGKARISNTTTQSELRAVRQPDRPVRRRLPVGDRRAAAGPSQRGPTGATPSRAPTRARRPRTRTTAAPTSSSAAPSAPQTGGAATPARMTAAWTRTSTGLPLRRPIRQGRRRRRPYSTTRFGGRSGGAG